MHGYDVADVMGGLYGDGIIALPGAFGPDWADRMAARPTLITMTCR